MVALTYLALPKKNKYITLISNFKNTKFTFEDLNAWHYVSQRSRSVCRSRVGQLCSENSQCATDGFLDPDIQAVLADHVADFARACRKGGHKVNP